MSDCSACVLQTQLREAELLLNEATLSAGQLEELEAGLVKGEELVQAFKEKKAAQRLKAEGRLVSNIEKSQRYMEKYVYTVIVLLE